MEARPGAYTGGEGAPCRQRKERPVDDGWRRRVTAVPVSLEIDSPPEEVTECNCSMCRRYGVLWAYYLTAAGARVAPRSAHRRLPVGQQILRVPPPPSCGSSRTGPPRIPSATGGE